MKKIAIFILFLFTISQAVPTAQSLFSVDNIMLVDYAEEHKKSKEDGKENKESQDFFTKYDSLISLDLNSLRRPCLPEYILSAPSFGKLTPPPNFG